MIEERLDGDIYLFGVRIYNGKRQSPVRWVSIILNIVVFFIMMSLLILWLSV